MSRITRPVSSATITFIALIISFICLPSTVFAQGLIIEPIPSQPWEVSQPITVESESIEVDLDDQFAHVRFTQILRNNTWMDLEGIYMFPLPTNADISNFSLWMDGRELTSETLDANEANRIYQDIVNTMRDPGLLEYIGDGLIRAHVYPIPAQGTKQVDVYYDWLLPIESGLIRMDLPLRVDGYSVDYVESLAITVNINSPDALGSIYSPTHDIDVNRNGARRATASLEKGQHRPEEDFMLYISRPGGAIGLNMLNNTSSGDEGYFLAMIAPEYNENETEVVPKDFVCVLDNSGSMSGTKIEQAKDALRFIFQNLNDEDRFRLITFQTSVSTYFDGWRDATSTNIRDVRDYIDGISAGGSTNFEGALNEACDVNPGRGRPMYIILLSDGLPTVGNTNTTWLVDSMNAMNRELNARLFCFGVGDDVDYPFIDRLARENGGYTSSVSPYEDLEQPLSDFYAKIKSPVMTDLELEINGTRVYDLLPVTLPDLFLGSQLVLSGRYKGEGNVTISLSGMLNGERTTYDWPVRLDYCRDNDYIPRHWATRRVGYLMNEIRIYGENAELVDEITDLAQRHGIITPYTSMLVTEDISLNQDWEVPMDSMMRNSSGGAGGYGGGGGFGGAAPAPTAQQHSIGLQSMEAGEYYDQAELVQEFVQYQAGRTFYQNADLYWVDSEYDEETQDVIEIEYLSDEYFELIDEEPDVSEFLALGEQVIFIYEGQAYQVNPQSE